MAKRRVGTRGSAWSRRQVAGALGVGAVVTAGVAVWLSVSLIELSRGPAKVTEPRYPLVVAVRELVPGQPIRADDVALDFLPAAALPHVVEADGSTTVATVFPSREAVVGQIPRERVLPREAVRRERLVDLHAGIGLSAVLPSGTRAVSLDLGGTDALTGFLEAGAYVDVLATGVGTDRVSVTRTVLEVVPVLAVNGHADGFQAGDAQRAPTVTLQLFPEQVERLALADTLGEVTLVLRASGDLVATRGALPPPIRAPVLPPRPAIRVKRDEAEPIQRHVVVRVRGAEVDHLWFETTGDTDGR